MNKINKSEVESFDEFNLKKSKEKLEDSYLPIEETLTHIIREVEQKKSKEKKTNNMWWGARKTAEMSFICLILWQLLQYNQENTKEYFRYIDEKIEIIKSNVGKVTLDNEQAILVVRDFLKVHNQVELSYFDKLLSARYPQSCIKDSISASCKKRIKSDIQRRFFYLKGKLNKFSSEKGLLGDYFKERYPKDSFIDDVNTILFSDIRKNYKMDSLKVLINDYETEFIRQLQIKLEN